MNRRHMLSVFLVAMVLVASAIAPFLRTADASAGCNSVGGLSGSYDEFISRNSGAFFFSAGETIAATVTASTGNPGDPNLIRLAVTGPSSFDAVGASTLSYTIPSDGTYDVTVQSQSGWILTISVSCGAQGSGAGSWGGFTDGRLSPSMAENYSLWCLRNNLDVYHARGGLGVLIVSIPLVDLISMPVPSRKIFTTPNGPIVTLRDSSDGFRVTGNNGNNAPQYAEKAFSLYLCGVNNGGLPAAPTPTRTPVPATPTATTTPVSTSGSSGTQLVSSLGSPTSNDLDGDGVRNSLDLCPSVYAPPPQFQFGCPDDDGDGFSNPYDRCPREAGTILGCPDPDGDGIVGTYDYCPSYAPPAGTPSINGCSDGDADGYANARDSNGFPLDWCPLAGKSNGVPHLQGCPDPDADGLVAGPRPLIPTAYWDDCPLDPRPATNGQCPPPLATPIPLGTLPPPVINSTPSLFDFASAVGSFPGLVVNTASTTSTNCVTGSLGFCGLR